MTNPCRFGHKLCWSTWSIPLVVYMVWIAAVPASAEALAVPSVTINGRTVFCEPPGIYQDAVVYLPGSFVNHYLGVKVEKRAGPGQYMLQAYANVLRMTAGETAYQLNDESFQAAAPLVQDSDLFVPVVALARAFNIGVEIERRAEAVPMLKLTLPAATVQDVRLGSHADKVRVVVDLAGPAGYMWSVEKGKVIIEVAEPAEAGRGGLRLFTFDNPLVPRIAQSVTVDGFTRLVITCTYYQSPSVFTLPEPARIVVDLPRPPEPPPVALPLEIPPEVRAEAGQWEIRHFTTPRGLVLVYVLKINPRTDGLQVRLALADATVHRRQSVLTIAKRSQAVAALNGGFFASQGPPLGLLIIDGEWIKHPMLNRTALGITSDGTLLMDRVAFDGRLYFEKHGYLQLEAINRGHEGAHELVVYTSRWGASVPGASRYTRLVVSETGEIVQKETSGGSVLIPADGYVISGARRYAELLDRVQTEEKVTLALHTNPRWDSVVYALGGGPGLVKDGQVHITAAAERFRSDITRGAASRSAVGITADNELLLVAVESAPGSSGNGMTLAELAQTMMKLGARDAMNLDGGGSTTVVQNNQVINRPRDGWVRAVSNALIVVKPTEPVHASE